MDETFVHQSELLKGTANKGNLLLRLIRAAQPISRTEIAKRLGIDKSTVTENVKPLLADGILREETLQEEGQGRRMRVLSFVSDRDYFIGVNLGVRHTQVGLTNLSGDVLEEAEFQTPPDAKTALNITRKEIENLIAKQPADQILRVIGVSVPGLTDVLRRKIVYAPNLDWRNIDVAGAFAV